MRIYYDKNGRPSGSSMSGREWIFWNNSLIGIFLSIFIMVVLAPFTITIAICRSKMEPAAKLIAIIALWGILVGFGIAGASSGNSGPALNNSGQVANPSTIQWYDTPCQYNGGIQSAIPDPDVPGAYNVTCNDGFPDGDVISSNP